MGLILGGIIIHIVFVLSVFDIYFTSPIIHGMSPEKSDIIPPAKRLVLITADGLRAESLYGKNISAFEYEHDDAPFLRSLVANKRAAWGISHTRVPTESRPGHVALAAGIYEDPSAIAKGWKENPVEFDSVFNESRYTWAWGSPDIVQMFAKSPNVFAQFYDPSYEDFSGAQSTSLLDTWVFDKVTEFFQNVQNDETKKIIHEDKIIFFLHLLGLDTAGHAHKPYSRQLRENLNVVDDGVQRIEKLVNDFYGDNLTTFIVTSDHGMTNWGSHGAGSKFETETPFIVWGAGILPSKNPVDIKQADIAPLISILLGIPIPVNSVGILPTAYLNMPLENLSSAFFANARQIFAQYDEKRRRTEEKLISWLYKPFNEFYDYQFKELITIIKTAIIQKQHTVAINSCRELIKYALKGIDYYHNYYQRPLLVFISGTYIGWILILLICLFDNTTQNRKYAVSINELNEYFQKCLRKAQILTIIYCSFVLCMLATTILIYVQSLPYMFYIYFNLPLYMCINIVHKSNKWLPKVKKIWTETKMLKEIFKMVLFFFVGIQLLIMSFFERWYLSIILIIISVWPYFLTKIHYSLKLCWTLTCICLSVFPFLPVVGSTFNHIPIIISAILWILTNFALLFMNEFYLDSRHLYMGVAQSGILLLAISNELLVDHNIINRIGLTYFNQITSCFLTVISILMPFLGSDIVLGRLVNIMMSFLIPFILLSVSYEPLFMLALFINLILWLTIEHIEYGPIGNTKITTISFNPKKQPKLLHMARQSIHLSDFRRGFYILLYSILAFFGLGNMASLNSFDPMWVRNFLSVFSPFIMAALILFKILIPYLVISCVFRAVTTCLQAPVQKIFFIVLIFCDCMGLQFLYLVKNTGSWLEIGSSISHFIIVQTILLFLLLLFGVAKVLTNFSLVKYSSNLTWKEHRR